MLRPSCLALVIATAVPLSAAASTNGLGAVIFGFFMLWFGLPAMLLGSIGALMTKVGYARSLGALLALIALMVTWHAVRTSHLSQFDEILGMALLFTFYASILHAVAFGISRTAKRIFQQDDAAMYKKYVTDAQQGAPGDGPRSARRG